MRTFTLHWRFMLLAAAAVLLLALVLLNQCAKRRVAGAEAALDAKVSRAQVQAGKDAVEAVSGVAGRQTEADQITRENDAQIRNAAGADQPLDRAVGDAGRIGLCRRAAYRGKPECVRFTPAQGMARTGAGSADAAD